MSTTTDQESPPADQDHVFERFYRGHRVRTGGSGIGLAVVAAPAHAHGGEVAVANLPDGGASFRIRLPAATSEQGLTR